MGNVIDAKEASRDQSMSSDRSEDFFTPKIHSSTLFRTHHWWIFQEKVAASSNKTAWHYVK